MAKKEKLNSEELAHLRKLVSYAALHLDTILDDWQNKVSVEKLNMMYPSKCICGQLGLGFYHVNEHLTAFWINKIESRIDSRLALKPLEVMWEYEIKKRR